MVKYYSDVTKKFYDTIVDCQMAEAKVNKEIEEAAAKEKAEKERKAKIKTDLEAAFSAYKIAKKTYFDKLAEAEKAGITWIQPDTNELTALLDVMFGKI